MRNFLISTLMLITFSSPLTFAANGTNQLNLFTEYGQMSMLIGDPAVIPATPTKKLI